MKWIIWVVSLAVALHYAFTTNYLAVSDAYRDYYIYNIYRLNPAWHIMISEYGLQNTAIFSTYLPGVVQHFTHLPPQLFFNIYTSLVVSFVPVLVYVITQKIIGKYAVFAALYSIGWVAFYQGASYARLNFAMLIYGGMILALLSNWKYKLVSLAVLAAMLPFAHYGSALLTIGIIGGCLLWLLVKKDWKNILYATVVIVSLVTSYGVWQVGFNSGIWSGFGRPKYADIIGVTVYGGVPIPGTVEKQRMARVNTPDKIIQAALGASSPDNDRSIQINRWMLLWAWFTVMLSLYGLYKVMKGKYSNLIKGLILFSFIGIGLIFVIPWASRAYGIEKAYYQAIMLTGVTLIVGAMSLSKKWLPGVLILSVVILPYVALMWKYGLIKSIMG